MPTYDLPALDAKTGLIPMVIDTPKGSRAKYKYDETAGLFLVNKLLPLGHYFPYNFGFIPGTAGEDGDALDVLLLLDEPLCLGSVAPVRLVGVLMANQSEDGKTVRNDRLIGVVETRYNPAEISDIASIHPHHLAEIEHFFISYNQMEGRKFTPIGRDGATAAMTLVNRYARHHA